MKNIPTLLKLLLTKNGYKDISEYDFAEKLKTHFGVDINEKDSIILFNQKEYDIDIDNKHINTYPFEPYYIEEFIINESSENEYNKKFITYNKIIFNDDIAAITTILQYKESREDIYLYFDYEKHSFLNQYALRNIDYNNFEYDYIQHLFYYNNRSNQNLIKSHHVTYISKNHSNVEDYFLTVIDKIFYNWQYIHHNELEKFRLISFLLEELFIKNENSQDFEKNEALIKYIYSLYEDLSKNFSTNKFFNQKLLEKYSSNYFSISD